MKKLKIVHAPVNIGNQPAALSNAEKLLQCKSKVVVNYNTWLKYPNDIEISPYNKKNLKNIFKRIIYALFFCFSSDVLHYYFGRSLMCWDDFGSENKLWYSDLKLAKKLGKKVIMTLQGCDVRIAKLSEQMNQFTACTKGQCNSFEYCYSIYDAQRQQFIKSILPLVDKIFFLNPELGHFIDKGDFLPYATITVNDYEYTLPNTNGKITIIHAPSDESIKGTALIKEAVDLLKNIYDIDFILVKGKTHDEAMEIYKKADIAIDQVLCGWYGAFAVELMAMGKPVMCYIRENDLKYIPEKMKQDLPILRIQPDNLYNDIKQIIDKRSDWISWSKASIEFAKKWHDPNKIAQAMIECYKDKNSKFDLSAKVV